MPKILFFKESVRFRIPDASRLPRWLEGVFERHKKKPGNINFVFCNDAYLRKMNSHYLDHHYNTDILTFDTSEKGAPVSGDIFISVNRVRSNAADYSCSFRDELHRVMVHGVLHLLGYDDSTEAGQKKMRTAEDDNLSRRDFVRKGSTKAQRPAPRTGGRRSRRVSGRTENSKR